MSRSGYVDYDWSQEDQWALIRWRGAVTSALRGKRGQAFLRELIAALDALPEKRLASGALKIDEGDFYSANEWGDPLGPALPQHCGVCALGAVGVARGLSDDELKAVSPEDREALSSMFGIAEAMAAEVMFMNDEHFAPETPEERWRRMRNWAESHLSAIGGAR